jgi:phosphatidylserine decarboxylase
MGAFRLGSTVINLFPKDSVEFEAHLQAGVETRMGERLAKIK